jgi:hypothetical protein
MIDNAVHAYDAQSRRIIVPMGEVEHEKLVSNALGTFTVLDVV